MIQPKLVNNEDIKEIEKFMKYHNSHRAMNNKTMIELWKDYVGLSYAIEDGFLFLFEEKFECTACAPLGEGNLKEALAKIKEYKKHVNGNNNVYCIDESDVEKYEELGYEVEELEDYGEYVYLSEKLITLSGKKLHKKRNHINKFKKTYEYEYHSVRSEICDQLCEFIKKWYKDKILENELLFEQEAIRNFLVNDPNAKAGVIMIDNEIVAFAAGEQVAEDMACVYFEKSDVEHRDVYPVINMEFVKNEFPNIKYINRQEDLGVEGLRKAKRSYYPEFQVKNFQIKL